VPFYLRTPLENHIQWTCFRYITLFEFKYPLNAHYIIQTGAEWDSLFDCICSLCQLLHFCLVSHTVFGPFATSLTLYCGLPRRASASKPKPQGPVGFSSFGNPLALDISASSEEPVPHDTADVLTFSPLASSLGSSVPPSPLSAGLSARAAGIAQPQMSPMSLSPKGQGANPAAATTSVTGHEAGGSDSDWDSSGEEDAGAADTTTDSFVY
jgi:hypothetical protein